jgi:hypothetical protein
MPKVVGENPFAGERYVIRQKLLTETLFYAGYTRESARAAMSTGNFSRLVAQGNDD